MPRPSRAAALVPTETALLWGLLLDAVLAPLWLLLLLLGRARLRDGLRPLQRVYQFVVSARMTAALILANLIGFALELHARRAGLSRTAFLQHFALRPEDLLRGHYLPLLTHLLAHASLAHLLGNLLALFVFGRVVERHLGPWRLLLVYLWAAAVSTALSLAVQLALQRSAPTLGASGAVAGLVALGVLFEPLTITFEALLPLPLFAVGWLAIAADFAALLHGGRDPIDHPAHVGGYLSVLLFYFLLSPPERRQVRIGLLCNAATALAVLLLWLLWH